MSDALKEAMAVLDAYMAGINRGDEAAVNAACNFPHVRLAGGKVVVWPNHVTCQDGHWGIQARSSFAS
jgi:hypothetical protein